MKGSNSGLGLLWAWFSCMGLMAQHSVDHWETAVFAGDSWHYHVGTNGGAPDGWQLSTFDNSGWPTGAGGFGYADDDDGTQFTPPPSVYSVFVRISFDIPDTSDIALAVFHMDYDDGFVAWLNGVEIARAGLGSAGDLPAWNAPATDHEAVIYQGFEPPSFLVQKNVLRSSLVNGANTLAIQVNNSNPGSSDMSCIPFLSFGMRWAGTTFRPVPDWFKPPFADDEGSHLPLIMIQTLSMDIQPDYKVDVQMGIIDKGDGNLNYPTDAWNQYNGKAGIEYRGSSSMMFPKKNYGLEVRNETGADSAIALLGMPAESDWVLHGPYSDKSLMRNHMAYYLFNAMGYYAPRTRLCELFINGNYQGVYLAVEKIERDTNRVNIAKLKPEDLVGDDLTGGYIVKIDRTNNNYQDGWFSPIAGTGTDQSGPFFAYHDPKFTELAPKQREYIKNKITSFEYALQAHTFKDPYTGYRGYIDVPSFINYFILVELSKNVDGYRLSTFLHKDRDDRNRLIRMGPVWDYDLAFGNADYLNAFNTTGWNYPIVADGWGTPFWWNRFMSDPYFVNLLNCYWHSLRSTVLSNDSLIALVDRTAEEMGPAIERNFRQWPIHGLYVWPNPYYGSTYEQDIQYMKNWILNRAQWIDDNIPGVFCTTFVNEGESRSLKLRAYPNPARGPITLEVQHEANEWLQLRITTLAGHEILSERMQSEPRFTKEINLPAGIYLIQVTGNQGTSAIKIIIQ